MSKSTNEELLTLIEQAVAGDKQSLETVLSSVQELVFNLSLRMLGTFPDAEDASQDILLKVMTHLSSYKGESAFSTWVFSIAANHLKDYKKHMFAKFPLSFEFYGDDINNAGCRAVHSGRRAETVLHECDAPMSGRREQMYIHSGYDVQDRQPDCRRYPWHHPGSIPAEASKGAAEDG